MIITSLEAKRTFFLFTTRAGGLGINLTIADISILYGSDWCVLYLLLLVVVMFATCLSEPMWLMHGCNTGILRLICKL